MQLAEHRDVSTEPDRSMDPIGDLIAAEGARLHIVSGGDPAAPCLVLLHGASGNLRDWTTSVFPKLTGNWHVIAIDRPGYGHSPALRERGWLIRPQVLAMRAALRAMGIRRYALLGHSYGVAVILDWALRFPEEVAGLLALSGAMKSWRGALGWRYRVGQNLMLGRAMGHLLPLIATDRLLQSELAEVFAPQPVPAGYVDSAGVRLALRPATFALNLKAMATLYAQTQAFLPDVERIACPTEVVHGAADAIVDYDPDSIPIAHLVPGSQFTLLPEIGHMPHHIATQNVIAAADRLRNRIE